MKLTTRFSNLVCMVVTIAMAALNPASLRLGVVQERAQADAARSQTSTPKQVLAKYESVVLRGKVIELGPYLMQTYQMPMDDDVAKSVMVLLTDSGEVHPIIKDLRSRGYWLDKRLRDRPMELHVHKFAGLPFVRLIDVYSIKEGKKYRVDYWCSVCAITTFEPGPCPCCQEEIQLREVPVDEVKLGR
jgi:hypothetical protein